MIAQDEHLQIGLRRRALAVASEGSGRIWLNQLWDDLSSGTLRIVDAFFDEDRGYLIMSPRAAEPAPGRDRLTILQDVLCSSAQKVVALERAMAPSTVASTAKLSLSFLGLRCNPSRVPPLVQQAARAARYREYDLELPLERWAEGGAAYISVSAPRIECSLRSLLSEAEFAVVCALVEGASHVEIARKRGTSRRTIANQLATAFRRLRVSSRGELLQRLGERQRGVERIGAREIPKPAAPLQTLPPPLTSAELAHSQRVQNTRAA